MLKKLAIIGVIAVILLIIMFGPFSMLSVLGGEDYNTGISRSSLNNLETKRIEAGGHDLLGAKGMWVGNAKGTDTQELIRAPMNNEVVVTAMSRGEGKTSVVVSAYATLTYAGTKIVWWNPNKGWYVVEMTTNGINWNKIIDTSGNQVDQNIISSYSGPTSKQSYADKTYDPTWWIPFWGIIASHKNLNPIYFKIKDTHTGALRITQMTSFTSLTGSMDVAMSIDYVYLASGEGTVSIVDPVTVYEEGETVKFKVSTGFSGQTQGGEYKSKGYNLKIYDNSGNCKKTWIINDDKKGTRSDASGNALDFIIPVGSYKSAGSNTWRVVLTNTLFDQDEETFFAIGPGMREQAPSVPTISFDKSTYNLGDMVSVSLKSTPNPLGRNTVAGFLVNIYYGSSGVDWVEDFHTKFVSASSFASTLSFKPAKGDTYITVEAWAFDAPESQGGIPSEKRMSQIWVKDKVHEPITADWLGIVVFVLLMVCFVLLGIFLPVPIQLKIIIIIAGFVISLLIYVFLFTDLLSGVIP